MENSEYQSINNGDLNSLVSSSTIAQVNSSEQSGKIFLGPGGKKEAEVIGYGLGKLRSTQLDELEQAKKYAMDQSIKFVMEKQRQVHQQQQQKIALYSQALALMGRIYVGSINFDVFEDQLRAAFGIFGPIKNVNMSIDPSTGNHKGFCFIEYEIPEAAYLAKDSMNGKFLGGRTIKVMPVGRQDSTPQAQPIIDMVMSEARQYNRLYVASVHPDISEQDLRSVFMAFGEITKCQLARHPPGKKHRGFGYIEFKSIDAVKDAIEGMNGFDLGGQNLQVGRCITPPDAINYLSLGAAASAALPAAAAIAAAEATAKIHAQEVLEGSGKTSPGNSPSTHSPSVDENINQQVTCAGNAASGSGQAISRRRFGGFAGSTIPPPAIIQSLPAPQLTLPAHAQASTSSTGSLAFTTADSLEMPLMTPPNQVGTPQLIIPKLGIGTIVPPPTNHKQEKLAGFQLQQEADTSIDDFYSSLKDEKFQPPPALIASTTSLVQPQLNKTPIDQQKTIPSLALPSTTAQPPKAKKQKKEKKSGLNLLERISEKAKAKTDGFDASKQATFAPLAPHLAPRDTLNRDEESGPQLAIGGPESWMALAIREDGNLVEQADKNSQQKGGKGDQQKGGKRKGKGKKPKITSGPKLNTATKIAAANVAGALSDQLQAQKDEKGEEATLASQEHVQIRGNDARHLLIQKLMRTNRSSVIVLKNMVTPDGVDEYIEDEIRQECQKYGNVIDVVIVQEEDSGTVKIFVRFAEPVQAEEARKAIDGRFFDGRTVIAQPYDQVLFDHDDFTG